MCSFSLGEDTGGSIRGPAALNGCVGLRPTHGLVSRRGAVMAAYTSDTIGPLARTVEDAAHVLEAIAGFDPDDPLSIDRAREPYLSAMTGDVRGMRIGVVREIAEVKGLDPQVAEAFERALDVLRGLGVVIETVSTPSAAFAVPLQLLTADADVASWFLATTLKDRYDRFDVGTRTRLAAATLIPATVYSRAMRGRAVVRSEMLAAAASVDVLVCPPLPTPVKRIEAMAEVVSSGSDAVTRLMERRVGLYPFSLANMPALVVPMGFCETGLPLSIQFAARPFGERRIFRVADAYERAAAFRGVCPALAQTVASAA
jgi:aspartyl-tRNA(Asn)/glutamyl-tRNA(Gln) amidotransferase subunit A